MVWLIMTLVAFSCLVKYGRNIPITEDWLLVPPLTGNEPNLMKWLWAQNNEHRIPFPRLVLLVLLKIAKGDFRVGMLLNITALSALSYAMIRVAQAVRGGRTKFADAFFPVVLLHLGNWENLFWSWQFSFVFPTALVCTVLLVLVSPHNLSAPGSAVIAGICLMLLPLCGANGLLFLPFLAPWFIYYGFVRWRAVKTAGGDGGFLIGSALVALLLVGLYLIGYERPAWTPPNPGIESRSRQRPSFSIGFGPVARSFWMISVIAAICILLPSAAWRCWEFCATMARRGVARWSSCVLLQRSRVRPGYGLGTCRSDSNLWELADTLRASCCSGLLHGFLRLGAFGPKNFVRSCKAASS